MNGKLVIFTDSSCLEIDEGNCLFLIDKIFDFFQEKNFD